MKHPVNPIASLPREEPPAASVIAARPAGAPDRAETRTTRRVRIHIISRMSDLMLSENLFAREAREVFDRFSGFPEGAGPAPDFSDAHPDRIAPYPPVPGACAPDFVPGPPPAAEMPVSTRDGQTPSLEDLSAKLEDTVTDTIDFTTEGTLTDCGGRLELLFSESELLGMENSTTLLTIDQGTDGMPGLVSMTRTGETSTSLVFSERQPRQHSLYDTGIPGFPIELCVCTRRINNRMTPRGGTLYLDYVLEMRGVPTERTRFSLKADELK